MTLDHIKLAISLLSRSDYFKELETNNTMTIEISRRVFRADITANENLAKVPLWQVQEVGLYRQSPIMREGDRKCVEKLLKDVVRLIKEWDSMEGLTREGQDGHVTITEKTPQI